MADEIVPEPAMPKGEVVSGVRIEGKSGQLRIGGYIAADLGSWTMEGTAQAWTAEAVIVRPDPYWLDYGGAYDLRVPAGKRFWVWRGVTFEKIGAARLAIRGAGEPEIW